MLQTLRYVLSSFDHQYALKLFTQTAVRSQLSDVNAKSSALQERLEEFKGREAQLRANNKVQSLFTVVVETLLIMR